MEEIDPLDAQLAQRLKALRAERGWSLDDLAQRSGVSRATLSRLEKAEVSPTANVLGRLCGAYGMPMSRLMRMVEDAFTPLVRPENQPVWTDASLGFERRSVSPPAASLSGEAVECRLKPGARIDYQLPPRPGLEHHLIMIAGGLALTIEGRTYDIGPGDCLRYKISGPSSFRASDTDGAHYLLFIV
ncbi:helix-turn-helix domain-containing protein [Rhizobium sp. TRM95796]|uniref:helix-turn-helix domain-containing protein n=1 Tax=Rhizobium sp. TRM95796 TaxID=2979862 RepID=UPI0021E7AC90|nr:XRE family transcriptional regulator [Rhizobium sp. TRM95796]MCV3767027.1 XRE family transcriptional regulator [Rhizobium sp. TRM95796]